MVWLLIALVLVAVILAARLAAELAPPGHWLRGAFAMEQRSIEFHRRAGLAWVALCGLAIVLFVAWAVSNLLS